MCHIHQGHFYSFSILLLPLYWHPESLLPTGLYNPKMMLVYKSQGYWEHNYVQVLGACTFSIGFSCQLQGRMIGEDSRLLISIWWEVPHFQYYRLQNYDLHWSWQEPKICVLITYEGNHWGQWNLFLIRYKVKKIN